MKNIFYTIIGFAIYWVIYTTSYFIFFALIGIILEWLKVPLPGNKILIILCICVIFGFILSIIKIRLLIIKAKIKLYSIKRK